MKKTFKTLSILALVFTLGACSATTPSTSETTTSTEVTSENVTTVSSSLTTLVFSAEDLNTDYNPSTLTTIEFYESSITSDGVNAQVDGSTLTILDEGDYLLTGTASDAQIIISAEDSDNVHLLFNNLSLSSSTSAPVVVLQADKTIITLVAGTSNSLTDASTFVQVEEEPNATLYSKDDLTINGTGSLDIIANYNHGIYAKNDLRILDATLSVSATNDGIKGKDSIEVRNANITISANGDGLQSSNIESTEVGSILIESGTFVITAGLDGIQAENRLEIQGGSLNINSGELSSSDASGKSLKATNLVLITGGEFDLYSSDDAIHSNMDVVISGGNLTIESSDDGIHADANLSLLGGTVNVLDAYEGLEASNILIAGGDHTLTTYDDGVNGSGGSDASAMSTQGKGDMFASDGSSFMITGGTLVVNAQGDGLDSNGSISMSGGLVIVYGPTDNGNGPLDYNAGFSLTGGTLLAVGSSGMAMNVSESTQNSLLVNFSGLAANERVSLVDSSGAILVSVVLPKSAQSLLYTGANLVNGEVQLVSGGTTSSSEPVRYEGTLSDYSILETILVSSTITSAGAASMSNLGGNRPSRK